MQLDLKFSDLSEQSAVNAYIILYRHQRVSQNPKVFRATLNELEFVIYKQLHFFTLDSLSELLLLKSGKEAKLK